MSEQESAVNGQPAPGASGEDARSGLNPLPPLSLWEALTVSGSSILSARRLWLVSIALHRAGHKRSAKILKYVNTMIFHNYLPPEAQVSPDVRLGHNGHATSIPWNAVIGRGVTIMQNVTISIRPPWSEKKVIIEDGVTIGANSVLMTRRNEGICIGRGSRVGAGAVVTRDVPPQTIAISQPVELRPLKPHNIPAQDEEEI